MFCCTKSQQHYGQIVNSICLQEQCIKNKNQLSCPICIKQQHQGHNLSTVKKVMPELLVAHKQKQKYLVMLTNLLNFVIQNFGQENSNGQNVVMDNIVSRCTQIMMDLKNQVASNNQQISKMKEIFKNLNKNATQSQISYQKPISSEFKKQSILLTQSPTKTTKNPLILGTISKISKSPQTQSHIPTLGNIDTFSHHLKHPYLSLSTDCRTVIKSSHPGHRYAVLTSKSLTFDENEVQIKIDQCPSNNIMIGLCHELVVKNKQFVNNYGTSHGTYLIGQNGGSSDTAISFHHSIHMMNRKQIVGWNFSQGDILTVGFNFNQEYIYFKIQKSKNKAQEFTMALVTEDNINKQQIRKLVMQYGLKVIVLLQNVGDQVTLLES